MRCFSQDGRAEGRARSQRTVPKKSLKEESDEEEDYDERELEREAAVLEGAKRQRKKSTGHQKRKSDANAMEIEADETQNVAESSKSNVKDKEDKVGKATKPRTTKAESMKPKSAAAKSKTSVVSVPPAQSPSTLPESSVPPRLDTSGGDAEMTYAPAEQSEVRPKPKKPRKPRKSTDGGKYVPPKGEEESTDEELDDIDRPKRKKRKSA